MTRRDRFALGAITVLCVIGAVFGARVLAPGVSDEELTQELGNALVDNCEANIKYRVQGRQRTRANDKGTKLQVAANEALIDVVNELTANGSAANLPSITVLGKKLDRVNAQLNEIRAKSTKLLPLPDCQAYRDVVESSGG